MSLKGAGTILLETVVGGGGVREPSVRVAGPLHWCCVSTQAR
jgi:hypothetical protein